MSYDFWKSLVQPDTVAAADARLENVSDAARQVLEVLPPTELVRLEAYRHAVEHGFYADRDGGPDSNMKRLVVTIDYPSDCSVAEEREGLGRPPEMSIADWLRILAEAFDGSDAARLWWTLREHIAEEADTGS